MVPSPPPALAPVLRPRIPWGTYWAAATAWWTLYGVTTATTYHDMADIGWGHALRVSLASAAIWVPVTLLALWLAERVPVERGTWRRAVPVVALVTAGVVLARALLVVVLDPWVHWYTERPGFGSVLLSSVANNLFLFVLFVGVGHALVYARRVRVRDEQLARAELQHLKAQLHPHFLFNTLNAISASVRTDPEVATQMIARLSTLLRQALRRSGTQEVALEEELAVLGAYVDIQRLRFDDRLRVEWEVEPATLGAQVPHLLLQPLVENAIQHGIAPASATGTVRIAARLERGTLRLSVRDDGVGRAAPAEASHGIGLANTRHRLQQLYGAGQAVTVRPVAPSGLDVEIVLPYREGARP